MEARRMRQLLVETHIESGLRWGELSEPAPATWTSRPGTVGRKVISHFHQAENGRHGLARTWP
jgi:hypothetical protein